jgi:hypothetical protein
MCIDPHNEALSGLWPLITTQGAAMVDTCCTSNCEQGRKCPEREAQDNVMQFQRRADLHRWTNAANTMVVDFAAFWMLRRVNWWGVAFFAVIAVSGFSTYKVITGLAQLMGVK